MCVIKQLHDVQLTEGFEFDENDHDEWTSIDNLKEMKLDEYLELTSTEKIESLTEEVLEGRKAHDIIISFYDWIFNLIHPSPLKIVWMT